MQVHIACVGNNCAFHFTEMCNHIDLSHLQSLWHCLVVFGCPSANECLTPAVILPLFACLLVCFCEHTLEKASLLRAT